MIVNDMYPLPITVDTKIDDHVDVNRDDMNPWRKAIAEKQNEYNDQDRVQDTQTY